MPEPGRVVDGVRLGVTTLTVMPVRVGRVDRSAAAVAMSIAPAIGIVLGFVLAGVGLAAAAAGATPLVAAVLTVGAGVVLTRGLHLDGLADTADGLGSYTDPATSLAIMHKPNVGPFGVVAVVLVLLAQVAATAAVLTTPWYAALAAVVTATAAGRLGITAACSRGVPAARPEGLGALVAGTVGPAALAVGTVSVLAVAVVAVPGRPWQGPAAVIVALATMLIWLRHVVRRLGGVTGDVFGAACEWTATVTYIVVSI